jgi:hypothetical protein
MEKAPIIDVNKSLEKKKMRKKKKSITKKSLNSLRLPFLAQR